MTIGDFRKATPGIWCEGEMQEKIIFSADQLSKDAKLISSEQNFLSQGKLVVQSTGLLRMYLN